MEVIQQFSAVVGVLLLLAGTLWWLRGRGFAVPKLRAGGGRRKLESIDRLVLAPQQSLHLVRLGNKVLLVAASPAGCSLVTSLDYTDVETLQ